MLEDAVDKASTNDVVVRRRQLQEAYSEHQRHSVIHWAMGAAVGPVLDFGAAIGLVPHGIPLLLALIATGGSVGAAGMGVRAWRLGRERVFVGGRNGNDPHDAVGAIDAMIIEVKRPDRDMKRLQRSFDTMVDKVQELLPASPLAHLQRDGYYPSRPLRTDSNQRQYYLDLDERDATYHWNRAIEAVDVLRALLARQGVILERQVRDALAKLIPPLRAYLREVGVRTYRIEYLAGQQKGDRSPIEVVEGSHHTVEREVAPPTAMPATEAGAAHDVLSSVETRLNASGMMAAAALRTLILAFTTAEPALFMGDDRTTGELLVERHLPDLEKAFLVADDAAKGEERDQVRMDFARALGVLRDTLDGIMGRHVQAARDLLRDQAKFIEERHGRPPLSSD